jgi:hypothetical protein
MNIKLYAALSLLAEFQAGDFSGSFASCADANYTSC